MGKHFSNETQVHLGYFHKDFNFHIGLDYINDYKVNTFKSILGTETEKCGFKFLNFKMFILGWIRSKIIKTQVHLGIFIRFFFSWMDYILLNHHILT